MAAELCRTIWSALYRVPSRGRRGLTCHSGNQSTKNSSHHIRNCYLLLEVDENADLLQVRDSYLKLAKRLHPDSGMKTANAEKFAVVDKAYRTLVSHLCGETGNETAADARKDPEEVEFDIRHTAPQHRQYLEYGGLGYGTPSERQKQHQMYQVQQALDKVTDHKIEKYGSAETAIAEPERRAIKRHKVTHIIDRLVEDLIQESMSKGEFKNLPGSGKPLKVDSYHYVDRTTHRLNKVLIDSGLTPEWISLDKEVRRDIGLLRKTLLDKRTKLGSQPFTKQDSLRWEQAVHECREKVEIVNRNIDKYNMIVPILNKQRVQLSFEREISRVIEEFGYGHGIEDTAEIFQNSERKPDVASPLKRFWTSLERIIASLRDRLI